MTDQYPKRTHAPAVSILLPVYNGDDVIETAITSILAQSFEDFELLVLDDGSTDQTSDVVNGFNDQRVVLVKLEHRGLPATLNHGAMLARAPLLARQDADDWSEPTRIARQVSLMAENPDLAIATCWWKVVDETSDQLGVNKLPAQSKKIAARLRRYNPIAHGSVMIRQESFKQAGGYDENLRFAQDYDLWLRMIFHDMQFSCVQESLYSHVITPQSVARDRSKKPFAAAIRNRALNRRNEPIIISDLPSISDRQIRSEYAYAVGTLRLQGGERLRAVGHFVRAIAANPKNVRSIVKLTLTPLPRTIRSYVIDKLDILSL